MSWTKFKDLDFKMQIQYLEDMIDSHGDPAYGRHLAYTFRENLKSVPLLVEGVQIIKRLLTAKIPLFRTLKEHSAEYRHNKTEREIIESFMKVYPTIMKSKASQKYYNKIIIALEAEISSLRQLRTEKKAELKEKRDELAECYREGDYVVNKYCRMAEEDVEKF